MSRWNPIGNLGVVAVAGMKSTLQHMVKAEEALLYGQALGLTDEEVNECVKRESLRAYHSPDPFDWARVNKSMIEEAGKPRA